MAMIQMDNQAVIRSLQYHKLNSAQYLIDSMLLQLKEVAHSLKGSAAILGAARLQESALALEEAAHDGRAESGVHLVAQLAREVEQVIAFFADPAWQERLDVEPSP